MQNIKNIIFDYGNVIFEINFKNAQTAFARLGIENVENFFSHKKHNTLFDDFEVDNISPADFRAKIRVMANNLNLSDSQIDDAWNSLLIGVSGNNHQVLLEVKQRYRTFLLSNNNQIHYNWIIAYLNREFGLKNYQNYFEKAYFSQQMRLRKPNVAIFNQVIKENNLDPAQTLFIDDSPQHVEGAKKAKLNTLLMDMPPEKLRNFLVKHTIL